MHPHGYSGNFHSPAKDEVFVPIMPTMKGETHKVLSISGTHYSVSNIDITGNSDGVFIKKIVISTHDFILLNIYLKYLKQLFIVLFPVGLYIY